MKREAITKAVKSIERSIRLYQKKLVYQLEIKAEKELDNGNLKITRSVDYEGNIKKYEIILSDLATIKRAITNNQTSVKIFGTAENRCYTYIETLNAIREAGFDIDGDEFVETIELIPNDELEEA